MIHKRYRRDGTPDLRRWVMECDCCHACAYMISTENADWLVPAWPDMAIFCPSCLDGWADHIIASALRCPECDYTRLRMSACDPTAAPEDQHPGVIDCARCCAIVLVEEPPSWF